MWQHKEQMELSDGFFDKCKKEIGKSKRYLTRDQKSGRYDGTWKLIVPDNLQYVKNGVMMDADI